MSSYKRKLTGSPPYALLDLWIPLECLFRGGLSMMPKGMKDGVPGLGKQSVLAITFYGRLRKIPFLALLTCLSLASPFLLVPMLQAQAHTLFSVGGGTLGNRKVSTCPWISVTSGGDPVTVVQSDFLPKPWLGEGFLGVVP